MSQPTPLCSVGACQCLRAVVAIEQCDSCTIVPRLAELATSTFVCVSNVHVHAKAQVSVFHSGLFSHHCR